MFLLYKCFYLWDSVESILERYERHTHSEQLAESNNDAQVLNYKNIRRTYPFMFFCFTLYILKNCGTGRM